MKASIAGTTEPLIGAFLAEHTGVRSRPDHCLVRAVAAAFVPRSGSGHVLYLDVHEARRNT